MMTTLRHDQILIMTYPPEKKNINIYYTFYNDII